MALVRSFPAPTGAPLSFIETQKDIAGLLVRDAAGLVRSGILPSHAGALATARSDLAVDVAACQLVLVRNGRPLLATNDGAARVAVGQPPTANKQLKIIGVRQNDPGITGSSSDPEWVVTAGAASDSPDLVAAIAANRAEGAEPVISVEMAAGSYTATTASGVVIRTIGRYTATAGSEVWVRDAAEQEAFTPGDGVECFRLDLRRRYRRVGGSWVEPAPVFFAAGVRRSDGSLVINNGTTALRWEAGATVPTGYATGSDANGAFVTLAEAGLYRVTLDLPIDINANYWASAGISAAGASFLELLPGEESGTPGFSRLIATAVLWAPAGQKVWFPVSANAAGTMRANGRITIRRVRDDNL